MCLYVCVCHHCLFPDLLTHVFPCRPSLSASMATAKNLPGTSGNYRLVQCMVNIDVATQSSS